MQTRFFFNRPEYLHFIEKNYGTQARTWQTDEAIVHGWLHNNLVVSPLRASFGGLEMAENCSYEMANTLLSDFTEWAKTCRATQIRLTLPPDCYAPKANILQTEILQKLGYRLAFQDLNFHWNVTEKEAKCLMHKGERWKLNKSLREGYVFRQINEPNIESIYKIILQSRQRKGFELSLSLEDFKLAATSFPSIYHFFEVVDAHNEILAVAVTVAVSADILYVFYTADVAEARKLSPVVLLHAGIYAYAQAQGFSQVDLGTASLKGVLNEGVVQFKKGLGAIASTKPTFVFNF